MTCDPIQLGPWLVGTGLPPIVVAEAGINHNGDLALAHKLIDAAAECGADGVKFQNYETDDFLSDRSLTYEYRSQGRSVTEFQYDLFRRCELEPGALRELREHAAERGLLFLSTPTGPAGVDALQALAADGIKNGSDYLTNLPLIEGMARSGLPTVLSTGMATMSEMDDAVRAFRGAGGEQLILLHCTSAYPSPPGDANVAKIATLGRAFDCPVGFSDHTEGVVAATAAVVLGACLIEKHFTLDRSLAGPDHWFSSDPPELEALVAAARQAYEVLGTEKLGPTAREEESRSGFRLSCVAATDLRAGHVLTSDDIVFRRPGTGEAPKERRWLIGRELSRDVGQGQTLGPDEVR